MATPESTNSRGRVRVTTGIFRDRYGFDVRVKVRGQVCTKRFKPTTDLVLMQRWQAHTKAELLDRAADAAPMRVLPSEDWKRLTPSLNGWCYVYFVRAGERVKIGRAVDLRQRFRGLQTAHPEALSLMLSIPAHVALEDAIHQRFQHLREQGEWFRLAPDLVTFIEAVQQGANPVRLLWAPPPL